MVRLTRLAVFVSLFTLSRARDVALFNVFFPEKTDVTETKVERDSFVESDTQRLRAAMGFNDHRIPKAMKSSGRRLHQDTHVARFTKDTGNQRYHEGITGSATERDAFPRTSSVSLDGESNKLGSFSFDVHAMPRAFPNNMQKRKLVKDVQSSASTSHDLLPLVKSKNVRKRKLKGLDWNPNKITNAKWKQTSKLWLSGENTKQGAKLGRQNRMLLSKNGVMTAQTKGGMAAKTSAVMVAKSNGALARNAVTKQKRRVEAIEPVEARVVSNDVPPVYEERSASSTFDFIVGGFPKCGTTTLLKAFAVHPETDMFVSEQCSIASPGQADAVVLRKLDETLLSLSPDSMVKRSFKCPTAMYSYKSIVRMEKHSPDAKFVVGIRHPIKMLQSFYNYRVTEIYERNLKSQETIPIFSDLIESGLQWKGVSSASVRFELFLMQLGKTVLTPNDMLELSQQNYELAVKPSNFTVFLYTVDQLEDTNEVRTGNLRRELQKFLGLQTPIQPFGHENKNHAVGDTGHKESINICDENYKYLRERMLEQGAKTATWIRDHFIESPDVIVANKVHFVETLLLWSKDPCGSEDMN